MKKISLLSILTALLISCGGSDDGGSDTPKENKAPSKIGTLSFPTNNLLCSTNTLEFKWDAASDPDGDNIFYVLEISKINDFSSLEQSFDVGSTSKTTTLEKGTAYYWRVKAKDSKNLSGEYSEVYNFFTEGFGETNHVPFLPKLTAPVREAIINGSSTNLQWDASDVDNDPLTFDVYFDTVNPPVTKIGDNQTEKTINVDLNASTTYYWKVVVKDDKGSESIGQIWSFSTN